MDVLHPPKAPMPETGAEGNIVAPSEDSEGGDHSNHAPLRPFEDARALIKLIQCSQCSYPLRSPVTLPCGNSLCRQCLPPSHIRSHISYPPIASRQNGVTCPFANCQQVHPLDDCSATFVLLKIMDAIKAEVSKSLANAGSTMTSMEEVMQWSDSPEKADTSQEIQSEKGHARTLSGGRLVATYTFAEMGELPYSSDIIYHPLGEGKDSDPIADEEIVNSLKDVCQRELECHVCYNTMLDPVTAPCGHTFCRKCLARILDHSFLCPHCRRYLPLPPSLSSQKSNQYLVELLNSLWPEYISTRAEAVSLEERTAPGGLDTALFVCTVSFPEMPMFLHIFEPRYRLMIRRALEGNKQFGMLPYNEHQSPQGDLGRTSFMRTGVMLEIEQFHVLPDGRSFLLCKGIYRFNVVAHGVLDGYVVGRVERHSDISLPEEECIEAEETSAAPADPNDFDAQLARMSTAELMEIGVRFVQQAEHQAAHWLQGSVRDIYGERPSDPALFPYWFGSVAPISDGEKYKLLPTTSVRERLKIVAKWIRMIESTRW